MESCQQLIYTLPSSFSSHIKKGGMGWVQNFLEGSIEHKNQGHEFWNMLT